MAFSHLLELCVASEFGGGGAVRQPDAANASASRSARVTPVFGKRRFGERISEFVIRGEFAIRLLNSSRFGSVENAVRGIRPSAPGAVGGVLLTMRALR